MLKVLFVSHEASITGAPLSLLKIIEHLGKLNIFDIRVLIRSEGILEKRFKALAPTYVYYKSASKKTFLDRVVYNLRRGMRQKKIEKDLFEAWGPDLAYSNTAANGEITEIAHRYGVPVVVHVRELADEINKMGPENIERLTGIPVGYIAISEAVKDDLTGKFSIPDKKIYLVNNFIEIDAVARLAQEIHPAKLRQALAIPDDSFIVGGAGKISQRKGADIFIDIAERLSKKSPGRPIYFIWVGGPLDEPFAKETIDYAKNGPLKDRVIFTGIQENPYPYYGIFDLLLLTSRKEPFGNVIVEAGHLGKPFICFEDAGGPRALVEKGCGIVIKNYNVGEMAGKALELLLDPKRRAGMGEIAKREVRASFTAERAISQITSLIDRFAHKRLN